MDHDDDLGSAATARTAQILAAIAMLAENTARVRRQRAQERTARDEQTAASIRSQRLAEQAQARTMYGAALEPGWVQRATTVDAARVWGAAGRWAAWSGDALLAHQRAELRLRQLHPAAMAHFDTQLNTGADEAAAMRAAAPMFVAIPSDQAALAAQAAEALEDLSWAQRSRSEMDDRLTRADERTLGTQDGARHQGAADAAAARASTPPDLAAEGYPLPNRPTARAAAQAGPARTPHVPAAVRTR